MTPPDSSRIFRPAAGLLALALFLLAPGTASAQNDRPPPFFEFGGGSIHYTLHQPGNGTIVDLHVASPIVPLGVHHWAVVFGASYAWYHTADTSRHGLLMPDLALRYHPDIAPFVPYLELGAALGMTQGSDSSTTRINLHPTAFAAAGLRFGGEGAWGLDAAVRWRTLSVFHGTTREIALNLVRYIK